MQWTSYVVPHHSSSALEQKGFEFFNEHFIDSIPQPEWREMKRVAFIMYGYGYMKEGHIRYVSYNDDAVNSWVHIQM